MVNSFLSSNERKYSLYTSTDSIGINVDSEEESVPDDIHGLTSTSTQVQLQLETSFIQLLTPKESNEETQCIRFMSDSKCLILSNSHEMKEWHQQPIEMVLEILDVDPTHGLVLDQVQQRKHTYGLNTLVTERKTPVIILFLLQFMNLIIGLLVAAAIAAIALQEWVEGIGILVIVILNAVIATLQEKKAGEALDALQQMSSPKCLVLREGTLQSIPSEDIVPGDVIHLTTGDIVPADLRLIHTVDLKVNEMILTGESEDVVKKQETICTSTDPLTARNMVFSSTLVTTGNAVGIAVETGMKTRVGTIASLLQRPRTKKTNRIVQFMEKYQPKQTPLQHSLHKLGLVMGVIVIIICLIVFGVGMIRGDVDPKHPNRPLWLYMVMAAVSLAVSAVPEGLPMVVTICLSTGTSDMVKQNVLVRKLVAVESLGASSVICTDKTGTLTEGKMTAINIWGDQKTYTVTGRGFEPVGDILFNGVSQIHSNIQVRATLLSATLCSNTTLQQQTTGDGHVEWVPRGNASEAPLVVAAAKAGIWFESLKETFPRMVEIPFCSTRKMMITVSKVPMLDARPYFENLSLPLSTQFIMNVKGAPHYIIDKCINYVSTDGSIVPMELDDIQDVLTAVDELSSQSLRVLAVAICPIAVLPFELEEDVDQKYKALCTKPWTLVGLIASMDPPRPGVKKSIQQARDASIRTVMITGDYYKTAIAIAKKIDLLQDTDLEGQAIDCKILRPNGTYLKPYEVDEITRHCSVFARAKPEDKMEIVQSLQRQGHVTAMTGDGVNDAPALQESDIGIAMGISGTAVAQRLSDMILTDDNYCSIVAAVEKGREIYTNIQRFVCFLLSTNFGEITLIFIAIAIGLPTPLAPLQILVLNVFADGMAAVALSLEKGDGTVMKECSRPRSQPIIYGRLWIIVMINALLIAIGALIVFSTGLYWNFGKIFLKDITGEMNPLDYPNATCSRWLGSNNGWQIYTSCDSSSYKDDGTMYCVDDIGYNCISHGISRAQTMTFVFMTHMEMLRAYTARSFTQSMFYHFFSNRFMQIAAIGMIGLTLSITNIPFLKDQVFGLASIAWFEWVYAIAIAIFMITLGELMKWCYRCRDGNKLKWKELNDELMQTMEELRYVRGRMQGIEDKLEIVLDHQEKRDLHMESPLHSSTSASNSSDSSDAETQK